LVGRDVYLKFDRTKESWQVHFQAASRLSLRQSIRPELCRWRTRCQNFQQRVSLDMRTKRILRREEPSLLLLAWKQLPLRPCMLMMVHIVLLWVLVSPKSSRAITNEHFTLYTSTTVRSYPQSVDFQDVLPRYLLISCAILQYILIRKQAGLSGFGSPLATSFLFKP